MSNVLIQDSTMSGIGEAIRTKTGGVEKILPADMPEEILKIQTGGLGDVTGPSGAADGNIAVFSGATGKVIKDSGVKTHTHANLTALNKITEQKVTEWDSKGGGTGDVVGPGSAVSGNIAVFDGATGKKVKDSGVSAESIGANEKRLAAVESKTATVESKTAAIERDFNYQTRVSLGPGTVITVDGAWAGLGVNEMNAVESSNIYVTIFSEDPSSYCMQINGAKEDHIKIQNIIDNAEAELDAGDYTVLSGGVNGAGIRVKVTFANWSDLVTYDGTENGIHFGQDEAKSREVLLGASRSMTHNGFTSDTPDFFGPLYEVLCKKFPAGPAHTMALVQTVPTETQIFKADGDGQFSGELAHCPAGGVYYLDKCPVTGEESGDALLFVTASTVGGLGVPTYLGEFRCYAMKTGNLYYGLAMDSYAIRSLRVSGSDTGFDTLCYKNSTRGIQWHKVAFEQ